MDTKNKIDSKTKYLIKIALQKHHLGQFEAAINYYEQILEINPNFAEVYASLAEAQDKTGDSEAAIKSYQQAIKSKPEYAEAYCNLGNLFKKQGNVSAAIEYYQKALKIKDLQLNIFWLIYCFRWFNFNHFFV